MFGWEKVVEERIREALVRGDFENLPGQGLPLMIEDDRHIPEDLRLAYKVLRNADCLPPELELKKEIRQMEDLLAAMPDDREKYLQMKRLNFKITQLNLMGKKSPLFEEQQVYYQRLVEKFGSRQAPDAGEPKPWT